MTTYASKTQVSVARSKVEIQETLERFGADGVIVSTYRGQPVVMFELNGRPYKMTIHVPSASIETQAQRVKWRALSLLIKAKVVAVTGDEPLLQPEAEFVGYAMLPDHSTVGEHIAEDLIAMHATGQLPGLIPRGRS
jgi:environmental stress-induced protein Ves